MLLTSPLEVSGFFLGSFRGHVFHANNNVPDVIDFGPFQKYPDL